MNKKELQEERMRGYFIEAAKTSLKGEGLKSISVRNIAEQAGYSYATMYNYFKDIKDLVFECVVDFQEECAEQVRKDTEKLAGGPAKIKAIANSYIKYFVQYPGIFELFFLEPVSGLGIKKSHPQLIYSFLDRLCEEEWAFCRAENIYSAEEIEVKKSMLRNVTAGLLLFYLNRRQPSQYAEFTKAANRLMDEILGI